MPGGHYTSHHGHHYSRRSRRYSDPYMRSDTASNMYPSQDDRSHSPAISSSKRHRTRRTGDYPSRRPMGGGGASSSGMSNGSHSYRYSGGGTSYSSTQRRRHSDRSSRGIPNRRNNERDYSRSRSQYQQYYRYQRQRREVDSSSDARRDASYSDRWRRRGEEKSMYHNNSNNSGSDLYYRRRSKRISSHNNANSNPSTKSGGSSHGRRIIRRRREGGDRRSSSVGYQRRNLVSSKKNKNDGRGRYNGRHRSRPSAVEKEGGGYGVIIREESPPGLVSSATRSSHRYRSQYHESSQLSSAVRTPISTDPMNCDPPSSAVRDSTLSVHRVSCPSHDMNEGEEGTARWDIGDTLRNGRYIIEKYLDSGAFSTVVQCKDTRREETVAIKVVRSVPKYLDSAKIEIDILVKLREYDPSRQFRIVRFHGNFESRLNGLKHVCMVFEKLGCSLFQFVKKNDYRGFYLNDIRDFLRQVLEALAFIHSKKVMLAHTDLKLENVLLADDSFLSVDMDSHGSVMNIRDLPRTLIRRVNSGRNCILSRKQQRRRQKMSDSFRLPISTEVRLIDFGGAVWMSSRDKMRYETVNTRQYRAPEVIMGVGWNCSSDMWSLGCIAAELYTGELLFSTHENIEHLALMQKILNEQIPKSMVDLVVYGQSASKNSTNRCSDTNAGMKRSMSSHVPVKGDIVDDGFFDRRCLTLRWPSIASSASSVRKVESQPCLRDLLIPHDLFDLVSGMLHIDPASRLTADQALNHPFFRR